MSLERIGAAGLICRQFLSAEECAELVSLAETAGFESAQVRTRAGQAAMPHIRNNQRAILASPPWVQQLWARMSLLALPRVEGCRPAGLPAQLRFYKYEPGERFKMHKDGPWVENGLTSKLTALVYLNEGYTGGQTVFRDVSIEPETGMLLLFEHPTWHEGAALVQGTKYVLRSDVLYEEAKS